MNLNPEVVVRYSEAVVGVTDALHNIQELRDPQSTELQRADAILANYGSILGALG